MNKYLDIRFMAFGRENYEITRRELDYTFYRTYSKAQQIQEK